MRGRIVVVLLAIGVFTGLMAGLVLGTLQDPAPTTVPAIDLDDLPSPSPPPVGGDERRGGKNRPSNEMEAQDTSAPDGSSEGVSGSGESGGPIDQGSPGGSGGSGGPGAPGASPAPPPPPLPAGDDDDDDEDEEDDLDEEDEESDD